MTFRRLVPSLVLTLIFTVALLGSQLAKQRRAAESVTATADD